MYEERLMRMRQQELLAEAEQIRLAKLVQGNRKPRINQVVNRLVARIRVAHEDIRAREAGADIAPAPGAC